MPGVFEAIQGKSYNRPRQTLLVSNKQPKKNEQAELVATWQKDKSPQNTRKVLDYLKPTIQSALHSYTPGQQNAFRLKATQMAIQSLATYDPKKAAAPATHVFTNLQRLNRIRRQRQNPVHIPESQVYAKQQLDRKTAQLQDRLGRQPTDEQLSDFTGLSRKKLDMLRQSDYYESQSATADSETGADLMGNSGLSDRDFYNYVYDSVPVVDKKIMEWTSGFGKKPLSNNQIANKLHMCPGAVSQHKAHIQELLGKVRGLL